MSNNQIIFLLCGSVICYDEAGFACKLDQESQEKLIAAVKRSDPIKPKDIRERYGEVEFTCPVCETERFYSYKPNYCDECGQKYDWSEEE